MQPIKGFGLKTQYLAATVPDRGHGYDTFLPPHTGVNALVRASDNYPAGWNVVVETPKLPSPVAVLPKEAHATAHGNLYCVRCLFHGIHLRGPHASKCSLFCSSVPPFPLWTLSQVEFRVCRHPGHLPAEVVPGSHEVAGAQS